jgi:proton-translocating NADH-quinone oxidoreductase chain N
MNQTTALSMLLIMPLAAAPVVYLAGRASSHLGKGTNIARWLALFSLIAACIPLVSIIRDFDPQTPLVLQAYSVTFLMDGMALLMSAVVLLLGILVTLFSFIYMDREEGEEKFYALLVVMIGTIIGLSSAGDLFNLWVWFETMAVSSFMLVAFYRNQPASLEAGVKYLVQSAVGSVFIILGIAMVFAQSGSLDLLEIQSQMVLSPLYLTAGAFFIIGFGVKSALVPLHTWLPDAHSQAPSGISAMLSGIVIEAGLIAMLRSLAPLAGTGANWGALLMGFGAANILLGNLLALRQNQIKRLLAYSSISHMGYIVAGIGIAVSFQQANGAAGSFFHLTTHALMKGLAFLSAGALLYALYIARGKHDPLTRDDLSGVATKYPLIAFVFSVAVLSLGGLPPLAGFMSKWQIMLSGFQTHNQTALWLAVFMGLNSVLSLGYYAPLVNRMYRKQPCDAVLEGKPVGLWITVPLVCMAAGVIVLGFYPSLLNGLFDAAGASLLAIFSS